MSMTVKNSKMARRYGEDFKRQAVELSQVLQFLTKNEKVKDF
jgi:hypothetical protein